MAEKRRDIHVASSSKFTLPFGCADRTKQFLHEYPHLNMKKCNPVANVHIKDGIGERIHKFNVGFYKTQHAKHFR